MWGEIGHDKEHMQTEECNMTPDAVHNPNLRAALLDPLGVPREALSAHPPVDCGRGSGGHHP